MGDQFHWTACFQDMATYPNWRSPVANGATGSAAPPALASFQPASSQSKLWCMHRGAGSDNRLWCMDFDFNFGWTDEHTVSGQSSASSPALAVLGNRLYCVYRGTDDLAYCTSSIDGSSWSNSTPLRGDHILAPSIFQGPGLAALQGQLWCVYATQDTSLWCTTSSDGQNWSAPQSLSNDQTTAFAPALIAYRNQLWCVYRGGGNDKQLYLTKSSDGQTWSSPVAIVGADGKRAQSDSAPALTPFTHANGTDMLMCGFRGTGSDRQLYTIWIETDYWSYTVNVPGCLSDTGPTLAEINGIIFCLYRN